jgi:hypothetical protein
MVDVKSKRCEAAGCDKRPTFDAPGGKGRFCAAHAAAGMVDVKSKRCEAAGCDKLSPTFDAPGGKGRFCVAHAAAGMVDVKHKRCEAAGCDTRTYYGRPGHPPTHCAAHRQPGMIRRPNARCSSCRELAIYGSATDYIPTHCETHRATDAINLVERPCVLCGMTMVLDTDDRCEYCHPERFATARLAKQTALMDYLNLRKDLPVPLSTDKIVDGGACGKERPDRIYDLGDKILIAECDERQHMDRPCECEQTRMVNIGQSFGGIPVYFLRWNPDAYSPASSRKSPESLEKRNKLLGDLIRDIHRGRHVPPPALVAAIYLYYDDWDGLSSEKWQIITPLTPAP